MDEAKEIVKEMHHCNLHQVSAILTLAEAQLVAGGMDRTEARAWVEDSLVHWEGIRRDKFGRLTEW